MNKNTLKMSLRTLIVLMALTLVAQGVAAQDAAADESSDNDNIGALGVGIALGLAAIGAGYSQAAIGSAAVGMLAEDGSKFGYALIFTALPLVAIAENALTGSILPPGINNWEISSEEMPIESDSNIFRRFLWSISMRK